MNNMRNTKGCLAFKNVDLFISCTAQGEPVRACGHIQSKMLFNFKHKFVIEMILSHLLSPS